MRVAYDSNGYPYDVATGYLVDLYYDDQGNAYDVDTNEFVTEVILNSSGETVYTGSGGIDWNQVIYTAAQAYAAGQGAAQSGNYIPNPNQTPYPPRPNQPSNPMNPGPRPPSSSGGGSLNLGVFGNVPLLPLIAGGALFLVFIMGKARGGR